MKERKMAEVNIGAILKEAAMLKSRMAADKARLAELNITVATLATYPEGSNTGRIAADGVMAKVSRKTTVSWDQDALRRACAAAGPESFRRAWTYEYKPVSSRVLDKWLADPEVSEEARNWVLNARTEKPAAPTVTYEILED